MAVRREYIADLYRNVLGREGSEGEITGWENSPDERSVSDMFYGSPEYTSKHGGQASWNDVGGVITPTQSPGENHGYDVQGGYDDPSFPGGGIITEPGTDTGGGTRTQVGGGSSVSDAVANFYRTYLGREPGANDVSQWLSGAYGWGDQNNLAGIERGIQTSEEASRRRAATPTESYSGTPYTGFETGGNDYSAFNTGRQQDPGKSAKDAFAMISNQAPPPPFGSKAQMANWFNTYVRPGMNALGHNVSSVNEDGFTYSNHEGTFFVDFGQNSGATPGSMLQRLQWNATPADAATQARYATSGGGGSAAPRSTSGTMQDIRSLYQNLGQMYGGPGSPGVFNGPVQQVGQDPLSFLITGGLADFLERGGTTSFGSEVQDAVMGRVTDNPNISRRFESARELMEKGRRTQTNDARAALAIRGLLSEPGIPQGAEIGAIKRIEENIAPEFSRALRDIYTDETTNALSLATGMASDQAKQFLAGIGEGTARQTALANIALQSLGQNMAWNQFLAEFGLKRDQVLNELQNGRVDDVMQLLNAFLASASLSSRGYVGN